MGEEASRAEAFEAQCWTRGWPHNDVYMSARGWGVRWAVFVLYLLDYLPNWPLQRLTPQNVTSAPSLTVFSKRLKTNLFSHFFLESPVVPVQRLCHFWHYNRSFYLFTSRWCVVVGCSNRTTKFRMLFNDLQFVRINPYYIPERYFLHMRRLLADPEVVPEVTVAWCALLIF